MTRRRLPELVGFAVAYAVAAALGRATVLSGDSLSLVWPAAGVAITWFLVRRATVLGADSVLLGVVTVAVSLASGIDGPLTLVILVAVLVQVHLTGHLVRAWLPTLWIAGGVDPVARVADLARFTLAGTVGTAVGATVFGAGFAAVSGDGAPPSALMYLTRQLCGVLAVGLPLLLSLERLALGTPSRPDRRAGTTEALVVVVATILVYAVVLPETELPLSFLCLALTAWVASRFTVLDTAWYAALSATAVAALTLAGRGPFGAIEEVRHAAVVAQAFVAVSTLIALAIVLGRVERAALLDRSLLAEERARREAELLGAVVSGVNQALVVVDGETRTAALNPAAVRLLGTDHDAMPLDDFSALFAHYDGTPMAPDERPSVLALRGRTVEGRDVRATRPDGTRLVLRVATSHLSPPGEASTRAVLTFQDVTRDDLQREELRRFARVVAHDLRNPLTAIKGWSGMLERSSRTGHLDADRARDLSSRLSTSVARLEAMVEDLLDQATSRDRALAPQAVDLRVLLEEIVLQLGAGEHVVLDDELPVVQLDPLAAAQVFTNLVANALKYVAPATEPHVRVSGETCDGRALVRVSDNGVGIPEEQREAVFEEFHRAHGAGYQGTGLGLAIVRQAVERHGGQVSVRANDDTGGGGSTFELVLPAARGGARSGGLGGTTP